MIFFTSDIHFFHQAVLRFERRPFKTTEDMNRAIVAKWNDSIAKDDDVYILGDVSFGKTQKHSRTGYRCQLDQAGEAGSR